MTDFAGLRVGLVGPLPPPSGGMANQLLELARCLRSERAIVHELQTNAPYRPGWVAGVPVVRAAFRIVPYVIELIRLARRCDVLHVFANSGWSWHLFAVPAIWVAAAHRVAVVVHYHGGEAAGFLARSHAVVRGSLMKAGQLVVPSEYLVEVFRSFGLSARPIPNLIDLDRLSCSERATNASPHLVVTRNLEPVYGNEIAIRAFARVLQRHPTARLTIAGSGTERDRLTRLAAECGVASRVTLAGRLDRDAMLALYRSADVSVNPSHVDNMPVSVLEAMACGVPVVSTNVGGIPYIVRDHETGLLVEPGDAVAMGDAIVTLLHDVELRNRIVSAARRAAERCGWPDASAKWLAVYREAIGSPAGRVASA